MFLRTIVLFLLLIPTFLISGISHPACFTENRGQWPEQVKFRAELPGSVIWVTDSAVVTDYYKIGADSIMHGHVIGMNYLGRESEVSYSANEPLKYYESYFTGKEILKAQCFREIVQHGLYKNIDVRYYFDNNKFRYDFIVNPGASPQAIKLRFSGQYSIDSDEGQINIATRFGDVKHCELYAYQNRNDKVNCCFDQDENRIGFKCGIYDKTVPLIIDPAVVSCGVLANSWTERLFEARRFSNGDLLLSGEMLEHHFPLSDSLYNDDLWAKFNLVRTSYDMDTTFFCYRMPRKSMVSGNFAIDSKDNIFIVTDYGFDTLVVFENSYQKHIAENNVFPHDMYIYRTNSDFSKIEAATFLGGCSDERFRAIEIDNNDNVIIALRTDSAGFPITENAYNDTHNPPGKKIVIAKLDNNLSELIFSTYLTKNGTENFGDLILDSDNNIYICGSTRKGGLDITEDAFRKTNRTEIYFPGYLCKMNANGTNLEYGSYLDFLPLSMAFDSSGYLYMAGIAEYDGLATMGTYQPNINKEEAEAEDTENDLYICKFNKELTDLESATYLGGVLWEMYLGATVQIDLDKMGNIYLVGETYSYDFPVTPDAMKDSYYTIVDIEPWNDLTFSVFDNDMKELKYSTYIGGCLYEDLTELMVDPDGRVLAVGNSTSPDFFTTDNSEPYGMNNDIFVFRYTTVRLK